MLRSLLMIPSLAAIACTIAGCSDNDIHEVSLSSSEAKQLRSEPDVVLSADDWTCWRGMNGDNIAAGDPPPTNWSEQENILWKTAVPGRGHSSPIVCGQRIYLTTANEDGETQSLLCFDRGLGKPVWNTIIHEGKLETSMHSDSSHASATPAFDGERVIVVFLNNEAIWATAVDLDGKRVWKKEVGSFNSMHGYGSSPVLYKSLVIVAADSRGGGFVSALDRKTGDVRWRVKRESGHSFATPIIANVAGKTQLLLSGHESVHSYDPATGEELWHADGTADSTANTMAWADGLVFGTGGYPQNNIMAFKADGSGEVVWRRSEKLYVASPLVVNDTVFCVVGSRAFAFGSDTGEVNSKLRLGGSFYASPTLANDHVYVPNKTGLTYVLSVSPKLAIVAENKLSEGCYASPVICGGRIYLRTYSHLYCIGRPST